MLDHALDRERAGQQARRGRAIAGLERLADAARGDRLAVLVDRRDRVDREAVGLAEQLQHLDIAAAALAEGEILAGDDAGRADPADQIVGDEIGRGDRGELGAEMEDQHRIRAGLGEQPLALVERGQAEGRQVRLEEAHRMRIEGRDQHRPPLGAGARHGAAHHRLVALVKSVEIAERDDAAAKCVRNRRAPVQALHGTAYRKRRGRRCLAGSPFEPDEAVAVAGPRAAIFAPAPVADRRAAGRVSPRARHGPRSARPRRRCGSNKAKISAPPITETRLVAGQRQRLLDRMRDLGALARARRDRGSARYGGGRAAGRAGSRRSCGP